MFTPGRSILTVPSKETPPIVLAFCRAVAVAALPPALPDTLPVTSPVRSPTSLVAVTDVRLISESRATDTPLAAEPVVVTLEPPEMVRSSVASEISSEPESPSTVSVVTMLEL